MDPLPSTIRPLFRDRALSDTFAARPRLASEPLSSSPRRHDDNRSVGSMNKALESMLRTTTETGEIGIFSIKPSRVPQSQNTPRRPPAPHDNGLQRPKPTFQPYGVPVVDDRRRLPSYARDVASEVNSMNDSASQKSAARNFENADYRSYSLTQTSYPSYTLSNYRSYSSLRSQQDGNPHASTGVNGPLQRPRSPFAYPTRLKRPGFRPSSPALTDGGIIDYSRRAEIELHPYGSGHSTSYPSSLYALKRKYPLGIRPEGNRSTPSLLSQPSPGRRSSSTLVSQSFIGSRNGVTSVNTSPARSTLSLASTANLYVSATAASTTTTPGKASTTTTPGKIPPPSPQYYDYTEDFETDASSALVVLPLPPLFTVHKTIPEDRPMSAHSPGTGPRAAYDNALRISMSLPARDQRKENKETQSYDRVPTALVKDTVEKEVQSPVDLSDRERTPSPPRNSTIRDTKIIRLSGLGYCARELNSHVEEAFGLSPSAAFEIPISQDEKEDSEHTGAATRKTEKKKPEAYNLSQDGRNDLQQDLTDQFQEQDITVRDFATVEYLPKMAKSSLRLSRNSTPMSTHTRRASQGSITRKEVPHRASGIVSETGSIFLIETTKEHETIDRLRDTDGLLLSPASRAPADSPVPSLEVIPRRSAYDRVLPAPMSTFNPQNAEGKGSRWPQDLVRELGKQREPLLSKSTPIRSSPSPMPNFSHQMSKRAMARSDPPMLAPKPISPARQLRLKNSIPQLMKALPALPPEPTFNPILVPAFTRVSEKADLHPLSLLGVPFAIGNGSTANTDHCKPAASYRFIGDSIGHDGGCSSSLHKHEENGIGKSSSTENPAPLSPPKLRLKIKSSVTLRTSATIDVCSDKAGEVESSEEQIINALPPVSQDENGSDKRHPRFKLRVIRASESNQGTVRISRSSADSNQFSGLHLKSPKDLFTPAGMDNMFRLVSEHMHSRRTSTNSNFFPDSDHGSLFGGNTSSGPDDALLSLPTTQSTRTTAGSSYETRSAFSDDSSRVEAQNSLRGKLSNLKHKMSVPYMSRHGTQSHDDVNRRDRVVGDHATLDVSRAVPNPPGDRSSAETTPARRFGEKVHRKRLKKKMYGWFRGARDAIRSRVRT